MTHSQTTELSWDGGTCWGMLTWFADGIIKQELLNRIIKQDAKHLVLLKPF